MKKYILLIVLGLFGPSVFANEVTRVSLADLSKHISQKNYTVLQEAERSYQARENINQARRELLPRLNIWSLAKVVTEPTALLDVVSDIAPFLIPGNWFRLKQTEILYQAEKEAYRALLANELSANRTLYFKILLDQQLYQIVQEHHAELRRLFEIGQARYAVGMEQVEAVRALEIQMLKLEEDEMRLGLLLSEELSLLALNMGLTKGQKIELEPISFARPTEFSLIDPNLHVAQVLEKSPEAKQYDHFLRVIPQIKKEIRFRIFGVSDTHRGVAGGIFDHIPISQSFSSAPSVRILNSEKKILQMQKQGILEGLQRQLVNVANYANSVIEFYPKVERRENLAVLNAEALQNRYIVGEKVELLRLADAYEMRTIALAAKLEQLHRFHLNQDRLLRLKLEGDYKAP